MAAGIDKLGLPSLSIPDLFLAEKISLFSAQQTTDRTRTPSPPTSPPPPGLPHPSSPGIVRPTIIQNVKENSFVPVRRGSYPGTLNRNVIESATSYKSAVQGGGFCGSDGFVKSTANPIKGPPSPPQSEYSEGPATSGNGHGALSRRINPNIVELIKPLYSPWKWD